LYYHQDKKKTFKELLLFLKQKNAFYIIAKPMSFIKELLLNCRVFGQL